MKHYRHIGGTARSYPDLGGLIRPDQIVRTDVDLSDHPDFEKSNKSAYDKQAKAGESTDATDSEE